MENQNNESEVEETAKAENKHMDEAQISTVIGSILIGLSLLLVFQAAFTINHKMTNVGCVITAFAAGFGILLLGFASNSRARYLKENK